MILPVQERLILVLPVDIDQQPRRLSEHPCAHGLAVDPADAPPLHETPAQRKTAVLREQVKLFKLPPDLLVLNGKSQFHKAALRPAAEHVRAVLPAQGEIDGAEKERLSRSGLSGQNVQPRTEFYFRLIDQSQIFHKQILQHIRYL